MNNQVFVFDIETLGLDPWKGRILCIVLKNIETGEDMVFSGKDEKVLLQSFWVAVAPLPTLIGYNSDEFDIPFLIKRSLIKDVQMNSIRRSIDLRKVTNGFWYSYKKNTSGTLSQWARVLHIPVQTESGKEVFNHYKKGDWYSIISHCLEDVNITYALYLRCKKSLLL